MKSILLLFLTLTVFIPVFAQRTIKLRNLWTRPQVHVLYQGYTISFTIKDINKALALLAETGDSTYGLSCMLDTAGSYQYDLYEGARVEYHDRMQPLLQNGVGAFLLLSGHAVVMAPRRRKLKEILADIQTNRMVSDDAYIQFFDPKNNKQFFSGSMKTDMYNRDLGID